MDPEELIWEAHALSEQASSLVFQENQEFQNEAVFCVFMMRQKVLSLLGKFDNAPRWIYDLDAECSVHDLYFLSCAVHRLFTSQDTWGIVDSLARYQNILTRIDTYIYHSRRKLPAIRGFGTSSSELVARYQNIPLHAMQSDATNFLIDIHRIKKLWNDSTTSREIQRSMVMELITIRESLHSIFTKIWTDCSLDDEKLDDVLKFFNGACARSLHDVPLLIEEVETGDVDGSITSFIDFLQVVTERIVDFFETDDYRVFRGVTFIASEYSEELGDWDE